MKRRVGKIPTAKKVKKAGQKRRGYTLSRRSGSGKGVPVVCPICGERFKDHSDAIWHHEIKHRDPDKFKRIAEKLKKLSKKPKGGR
jgi:hypothetical protein